MEKKKQQRFEELGEKAIPFEETVPAAHRRRPLRRDADALSREKGQSRAEGRLNGQAALRAAVYIVRTSSPLFGVLAQSEDHQIAQ